MWIMQISINLKELTLYGVCSPITMQSNLPKYTEVKQSTSKWSIGHKEFSKEIRKNSELRDN